MKHKLGTLCVDSGSLFVADLDTYLDSGGRLPVMGCMNYDFLFKTIKVAPGKYKITFKVRGWLGPRQKTKTINVKSDTLVIGDPCYLFDDDAWGLFLDKTEYLDKFDGIRGETGGDGLFSSTVEITPINTDNKPDKV